MHRSSSGASLRVVPSTGYPYAPAVHNAVYRSRIASARHSRTHLCNVSDAESTGCLAWCVRLANAAHSRLAKSRYLNSGPVTLRTSSAQQVAEKHLALLRGPGASVQPALGQNELKT